MLLTILLVVALLAAAMLAGVIPSPLTRQFSSAEEPAAAGPTVPCPPPDATPLPPEQITVNVLNATTQRGLASGTAAVVEDMGIAVEEETNFSGGTVSESARIVTGPQGLQQAYTIAQLIPKAQVALADRDGEVVDVVLGTAFEKIMTPDEASLDMEEPMAAPSACTPVDSEDDGEEATGDDGSGDGNDGDGDEGGGEG